MYCFKCENKIKNGTVCNKCGYENKTTGSFLFPVSIASLKSKSVNNFETQITKVPVGKSVDIRAKNLKSTADKLDAEISRLQSLIADLKNENDILRKKEQEQQEKIETLNGQKEDIENLIKEVLM